MATASASQSARLADDDDEWEYEYHETEREDLYFTLDLTRHVQDALEPREVEHGGDHEAETNDAHEQNGAATAENAAVRKARKATPNYTLHILDLHTTNPLVKFDESVYSCYWMTDVGTQFHIAQAGHVEKAQRPGHVLDIIGLSQTRLLGRPAALSIKNADGHRQADDAEADADDSEYARQPSSGYGQPLVIPREDCRTDVAKKQASFLERLSKIKLQKGEKDPVPIYGIRTSREPANKAELKRQALDADAETKKKVKIDELGRPSKQRKRLTAAERGVMPKAASSTSTPKGRQPRGSIASRLGYQDDSTAPPTPGSSRPQRVRFSTGKAADAAQQEDLDMDDVVPEEVTAQTNVELTTEQQMGDDAMK